MPNIKPFEAGEGVLRPSEAGSAAWREAGAVQQRSAVLQERLLHQTGEAFQHGITAIGAGLGAMQEKAQAHADAMAEIDFQNSEANFSMMTLGGLNQQATPTTAEGEPIESHYANGGTDPFPEGAQIPSRAQYVQYAGQALDTHSNWQGGLLERLGSNFLGIGVSQKKLDSFAVRSAANYRRMQIQAYANDAQVQINEALGTTAQTVKNVLGNIYRGTYSQDPTTNIEQGQAEIDKPINALKNQLSGTLGARAAERLEETRAEAHANAIGQAISKEISKGTEEGYQRAYEIANDPKWDKYIGDKRPKILDDIGRQIDIQARIQVQREKIESDNFLGQLNARANLQPNDPNFVANPEQEIEKRYYGQGQALINARKEWKELRDPDANATKVSGQTASEMIGRALLPDDDPRKLKESDVWEARAKEPGTPGSLNKTNKDEVLDMIRNPIKGAPAVQEALKAAKAEITMPIFQGKAAHDFIGEQNFSDFQRAFVKEYSRQEKAGILQPNALDFKDPNSLIRQVMGPPGGKYVRTQQQKIDDWVNANTGGGETALPGSTPAPAAKPLGQPAAPAPAAPKPTAPPVPDNRQGGAGTLIHVPVTQVATPEARAAYIADAFKKYKPGTQFTTDFVGGKTITVPQPGGSIVLDGKTYTNTYGSEAPKKMNYAPEGGVQNAPAQQAITKASLGPSGQGTMQQSQQPTRGGKPWLEATPGRSPDLRHVDPRLVEVVAGGQQYLPAGYKVTVNGGYTQEGHARGSQHKVMGSGALDVQIWGPNGEKIPNKGKDSTGMYRLLSQGAYTYMLEHYPELKGKLAHGAAFGTVSGGGTPDLMHFDLGGERGHLGLKLSQLGPLKTKTAGNE